MKKVVLLGFKGDACGRIYNKILIDLAKKGKINLTCVDMGLPENVLGVPSLKEMEELIKFRKLSYLDLSDPSEKEIYQSLSDIDVVFVVTPDITHSQVTKDFLGKAKRIFIEKPLDAILRNVRVLEDFPKAKETIFGYDHYLAKFYPFQVKTDQWLKEKIIGELRKIEFRLLEPGRIPPHRIKALDRGMIYDFFPHGLATIIAIPSPFAYPDPKLLKKVSLQEVLVARYIGCKISGVTFVKINFEIPWKNKIFCEAIIGKGIGKEFEKTLRIIGTEGEIFVNIPNFYYSILDKNGKKVKEDKLLHDFAKEFIFSALDFKKGISQIPGALPFESAKEILYILDEARWKSKPVGKPPIYRVGATVSEVEKIIEERLSKS